uniref:Uncharacterized protein n=1 Tax=Ciona intestinalis TaxID=7719 RepID=H2XZI1_CIOIN
MTHIDDEITDPTFVENASMNASNIDLFPVYNTLHIFTNVQFLTLVNFF